MSSFINNSDFNTTMERTSLKPGGALTFKGNHLYLSELFCYGNSGFKGGFLFFDSNRLKEQHLIVFFSVFLKNIAMNGGVFGITPEVKNIKYFFKNNYCKGNVGTSIYFIFNFLISYFSASK